MSDEIKVGDMVIVVRGMPCCGHTSALGNTFVVGSIHRASTLKKWICKKCSAPVKDPIAAIPSGGTWDDSRLLVLLKKIHPPTQDETINTDSEVTA